MGWLSSIFAPQETNYLGSVGLETEAVKTRTKPRLAYSGKAPTREEFEAWRDHPVSRMVFAGLARNADECREAWQDASWGQGHATPDLLVELRTRADTLRTLEDASYEAWCETLGLDPQD